ncbi:MAG: HIT family protein [Bdellovibrionaceae bacterium]|nr:HIT family protein [Pseudobdellovibrionaceae bacterium]NUM57183.1 HIT family protein [Pseudobdellovibrionaceae bacterium]
MASVFTKIINGDLPCYKIFEDDLTLSFLAIDQVTEGHTLVIPKMEVNHWLDVPEEIYLKIHANSQKIGKAVKLFTKAERILTVAVGFEVPHYHLHLIPAWSMGDLDFKKGKRLDPQEMERIQKGIVAQLKAIG